jgi:hypothetical protein
LQVIKQLRENLSDLKLSGEETSDRYLNKWVRARNLDVAAAENMFRKNVEWMDEVQVSTVSSWQAPEGLKESNPYQVCGFDKDGCPIAIIPLGKWDIVKCMNAGMKKEWLRMSLQYFEQMWTLMKKQSKGKDYYVQSTIIIDMENLSWRQLTNRDCVDGIVTMVRIFEANYPEVANRAFIVNAPRIFGVAWNLVKPFVSERTGAKLQFFGSDKSKWREAILTVAEEDQFIIKYGGAAPDDTDFVVGNKKISPKGQNGNVTDDSCDESGETSAM